jgi:hypothetical protein
MNVVFATEPNLPRRARHVSYVLYVVLGFVLLSMYGMIIEGTEVLLPPGGERITDRECMAKPICVSLHGSDSGHYSEEYNRASKENDVLQDSIDDMGTSGQPESSCVAYTEMYWKPAKSLKGDSEFPFFNHDGGSLTRSYYNFTNLIVVPGHAIYLGSDWQHNIYNLNVSGDGQIIAGCSRKLYFLENWILEDYQLQQLDHFKQHIKEGISQLASDPKAILLFSGGQTREAAGPFSEAGSYLLYAMQNGWFGHDPTIKNRVFTEDFARDSFENVLFSICRFYQITGYYPFHITVLGFPFKKWRFEDLHRSAIGFPQERFSYHCVGGNTTGLSNNGRPSGWENDSTRPFIYDSAVQLFQQDKFGCSVELAQKRRDRNPFSNVPPYMQSCLQLNPSFFCCS